ncbi:MAG: hypothetical protein Kow0092_08270 [Deferrisomatales bacterium]
MPTLLRIRRVFDCLTPRDRHAVAQVQGLLKERFPGVSDADVERLPELLHNPLRHRFRTVLFVAETAVGRVLGFATVLHFPDVGFAYLDFIATQPDRAGGGVGGALYERIREEARALGCLGLFFECLPDDPALCRAEELLAENAQRLRFYERHGARPIVGTAYETPLRPDDPCPPHLVFDDLGRGTPLRRATARAVVRAILERKYGASCPPGYVDRVVGSFQDDPVRLRPPRYGGPQTAGREEKALAWDRRIALVVNDRHRIHHVRERGYVEAPARVEQILGAIEPTGRFERVSTRHFGDSWLRAVHAPDYVDYLRRVCEAVGPDASVYPYVFPLRNQARPPKELPIRAGYYCIDTFTPLNGNAYLAARRAVDCGLTAADELLKGRRLAYALVRPPGHHAESRAFGGFCYFNTAAVAAQYLSRHGPVAVLDLDYHHGNGTQSIFYARDDVLTVSIHGHPRFAYPYFAGFADETGEGAGKGFNWNLPLPEQLDGTGYRQALERALRRVGRHRPLFLVVALGLDPAKADPTGTWSLGARDFRENGRLVGQLGLPTLVVQEGGYRIRTLGTNARAFFEGLWGAALGDGKP